LCDNLKVFQLSDEIISLVISLRKEGKIKLPFVSGSIPHAPTPKSTNT